MSLTFMKLKGNLFVFILLTGVAFSQVDMTATPTDRNTRNTTNTTSINATTTTTTTTTNATIINATISPDINPSSTPLNNTLQPLPLRPLSELFNETTFGNTTVIIVVPTQPSVSIYNTTDPKVFELIPRNFFVDRNGSDSSRDYLVMKTHNSKYIGCKNGGLELTDSIKEENLWLPSQVNFTYNPSIVIKALNGGFIGYKNNSLFDCSDTKPESFNYFEPIRANSTTGFLSDSGNNTNRISFKFNNTGYLGVIENKILLVNEFNDTVAFYPVN